MVDSVLRVFGKKFLVERKMLGKNMFHDRYVIFGAENGVRGDIGFSRESVRGKVCKGHFEIL